MLNMLVPNHRHRRRRRHHHRGGAGGGRSSSSSTSGTTTSTCRHYRIINNDDEEGNDNKGNAPRRHHIISQRRPKFNMTSHIHGHGGAILQREGGGQIFRSTSSFSTLATATSCSSSASLLSQIKMQNINHWKRRKNLRYNYQHRRSIRRNDDGGGGGLLMKDRKKNNVASMIDVKKKHSRVEHPRQSYATSLISEDDEAVTQHGNSDDDDNDDDDSFPSIGYDTSNSFVSRSHTNIGTRSLDSSTSASSSSSSLLFYPTSRTIGGRQGSRDGLTRLVLSTRRKNKVQRDLRIRGKKKYSVGNEDGGKDYDINELQYNNLPHPPTEEKKINDDICFYHYTEDDQSVDIDATEVIYRSASLTSLAEENNVTGDSSSSNNNNVHNNNCLRVDNALRCRKFSLFYEDDTEEEIGNGLGKGGRAIDLTKLSDQKLFPGDSTTDGRETSSSQRRMRLQHEQLQNLGRNGWHRALSEMVLDISPPPPTSGTPAAAIPPPPPVVSSSSIFIPFVNTNITTKRGDDDVVSSSSHYLDRLSVTHILQNVQPTLDEYSAIRDEYEHLMNEIDCLEQDRLRLEVLFYGAVEDAEEERKQLNASSTKGTTDHGSSNSSSSSPHDESQICQNDNYYSPGNGTFNMKYKTFRASINRISQSCKSLNEKVMNSSVPATWLVDDVLPLLVAKNNGGVSQINHPMIGSTNASLKHHNCKEDQKMLHSLSTSTTADESSSLEDRLRYFRGDGIALLIANPRSRVALVHKLCSQPLPRKNHKRRYDIIGSTSSSSASPKWSTSSFCSLSEAFPPGASCSSSSSSVFTTQSVVDPTSLDMLALWKLKSKQSDEGTREGLDDCDAVNVVGDDHEDNSDEEVENSDDPSAAVLIDEGGTYLTHCTITGGLLSKTSNHATAISKDQKDDDVTSKLYEEPFSSCFMKFDHGETFYGGGARTSLPMNLVSRLAREGRDHCTIKYLSTGPLFPLGGKGGGGVESSHNTRNNNRCYYAEFEDGECWWGTNNDDILDKIFMEMDVHRVAFGDMLSGGALSFVVIGKDGSVKWKNIPQGLQNILVLQYSVVDASTIAKDGQYSDGTNLSLPRIISNKRDRTTVSTAAAPCEVSLGKDGSYFVRFMDGTMDYMLPNFAADILDTLEAYYGKHIKNVALHVDTYDCFIRYSNC